MRSVLALLTFLAAPAHAWEFTPRPICTLSHEAVSANVRVTYDPASGIYAIVFTRAEGWPAAARFSIRFDGPRGLTITTDRHSIGPDGTDLSVTDTGFGNVLDGLEYNDTATALIGDQSVPVPLQGAAEPVRAFRDCTQALAV